MHLILQLITYVTDSQKLSRDLLIVFQMLDNCQLPISNFLTLPTGSAVHYNPSKGHIEISKEIDS